MGDRDGARIPRGAETVSAAAGDTPWEEDEPAAGEDRAATGESPVAAGGELRPLLILLEHATPEARLQLEHVLNGLLRPPPTAAARRVAELGHLARLLETDLAIHIPNHPIAPVQVSQRDYDRTRREEAPSAETLIERYGHWEWACRAASGLLPDGRKTNLAKPWASPMRGRRRSPDYTREDALGSIRDCAFALCRRPSSNVFKEWVARERRRRKRARGGMRREIPDAAGGGRGRVPGIESVYRHFPRADRTGPGAQSRWATALAAADITDEFLATAIAAKLPERIEAAPEPDVADTVNGRLALLTEIELEEAQTHRQPARHARPERVLEAPAGARSTTRARVTRLTRLARRERPGSRDPVSGRCAARR